jgi:ammonium transporter, Amt family
MLAFSRRTLAVGSISWMTMGYSLAYGVGNSFIGDATLFGHAGVSPCGSFSLSNFGTDLYLSPQVMGTPVYAIPELLYSIFQLVFSVATVAIFSESDLLSLGQRESAF